MGILPGHHYSEVEGLLGWGFVQHFRVFLRMCRASIGTIMEAEHIEHFVVCTSFRCFAFSCVSGNTGRLGHNLQVLFFSGSGTGVPCGMITTGSAQVG